MASLTNILYDVAYPSTMPSLTPLLCRHWPLYYAVTDPSTVTLLIPLLCHHSPRYYDAAYHLGSRVRFIAHRSSKFNCTVFFGTTVSGPGYEVWCTRVWISGLRGYERPGTRVWISSRGTRVYMCLLMHVCIIIRATASDFSSVTYSNHFYFFLTNFIGISLTKIKNMSRVTNLCFIISFAILITPDVPS